MTRKAERRARVGGWLLIVAAGLVSAGIVATLAGVVPAALLLAAALALGHRRMIAPPGVAILTYHSVSPDPGWLPWSREIAAHPATFARHLETLARMGASVLSTRALVAARAGGRPLPPRAVVLHFDDGYLDNLIHAVPLLRRHGFPATIFPSLDFVEPGAEVRSDDAQAGYLRWAELAAIAGDPLFEIEPHGVGHARVTVSAESVGTLTRANWRHHAWLQWQATPGPKHDWFRAAEPRAVPLGSPVPRSGLALAERAWAGGEREPEAALEARIVRDLSACRTAFLARLGQEPAIFCWPENKVTPAGRRIAAALGYRATTAGQGRNAPGEPADVLSRIHMGDRALGVRWAAAEALHLRAAVRLMQGNHYWYLVIAPMNLVRRIVMAARVRAGDGFA